MRGTRKIKFWPFQSSMSQDVKRLFTNIDNFIKASIAKGVQVS